MTNFYVVYDEAEVLGYGRFSDLFKDVNGYRPRHVSEKEWYSTSEKRREEILDDLQAELHAQILAMEEEEAIELASFIGYGAGNEATARRWMRQAEVWGWYGRGGLFDYEFVDRQQQRMAA